MANEKEKVRGVSIRRTRFLLLLLMFQFIYAILFPKIRFLSSDTLISLSAGGLFDIRTLSNGYRVLSFLSTDQINKLYYMATMFYGEGSFSTLFVSVTLSSAIIFYLGFIFALIGCIDRDVVYLETGLVILLVSDFILNIISFMIDFAHLTSMGIVFTGNLMLLALFSSFLAKQF